MLTVENQTLRDDEETHLEERQRRESHSSSGSVVGVISVLLIGMY
jgi:hypothetical protein